MVMVTCGGQVLGFQIGTRMLAISSKNRSVCYGRVPATSTMPWNSENCSNRCMVIEPSYTQEGDAEVVIV